MLSLTRLIRSFSCVVFLGILLAPLRVDASWACSDSKEDLAKPVNPVRVVSFTETAPGLFQLIYAVEQKSQLAPARIGVLFVPNLEDDFSIQNSKNLSVFGSALSYEQAAATGSVPAPDGYDNEGRVEEYFETSPIQIPGDKKYYIYSTGYRCNLGSELLSQNNAKARAEFLPGVGKGVSIESGGEEKAQADFSARDIWGYSFGLGGETIDSTWLGTLVKANIRNSSLTTSTSISLQWDGQSNPVILLDPSHQQTIVLDLVTGLRKLNMSALSGFIYSTSTGSVSGYDLAAWIPAAMQARVPTKRASFRLNITGTASEEISKVSVPTGHGNLQALTKITHEMYRNESSLKIIQFVLGSWIQGQIRSRGAHLAVSLKAKQWGQLGTLEELIALIEASRKAAFQPQIGLAAAPDMQVDAFLDAYSRINLNLPLQQFVINAGFLGDKLFEMDWPADVSLYIKSLENTGEPFVELPAKSAGSGRQKYLFTKQEFDKILSDGIWVKNERLDERLLQLHSQGGTWYRTVRGLEYETAKSGFDLQIKNLANGVESRFIGYIDPRPALSIPNIFLQEQYMSGWKHEKHINGYSPFNYLILPSKNSQRLRVARTAATFQTDEVGAPKYYTITDFPWNPGATASTDWKLDVEPNPIDPRGGPFQTITVNEFDITPSYQGQGPAPIEEDMGSISQKVRGLKFASTTGKEELIAPVHFHPNERIYTLYYGGEGDQLKNNMEFAYAVANMLRSQHKINIEVVNAAVLKTYSNYPRSEFDAKWGDFLTEAFKFNNGIPLLNNVYGINDGIPQTPTRIGYVYSTQVAPGEFTYGFELLKQDASRPWEARVSDDVVYSSTSDYWMDQFVGHKYRQHTGNLLAKDLALSKFGLWYSYSRPSYIAANVITNVDLAWAAATGIGKLGVRAGAKGLFRGAVKAEAKEVLEQSAIKGVSLYTAMADGEVGTAARKYFTAFEDAQKLVDADPRLVVKEVKIDNPSFIDFDKMDDNLGLVAEIKKKKRPDIFDAPHAPRPPPSTLEFLEGKNRFGQRLFAYVEDQTNRFIQAGKTSGVALSRGGVYGRTYFSRTYENLSGSAARGFPGTVREADLDYFRIVDNDAFIAKVSELYGALGNPLQEEIKRRILEYVSNGKILHIKDGIPGLHAEVQVANDILRANPDILPQNIQIATFKLTPPFQGQQFKACTNCSNLLSGFDLITGRVTH